ncbi:TetR/AcrR family transcriptional regulator [Phenylobacterium sp. J367]|uniref:TetR/AcrR family transcriptional regulator n=1 Tax=Phenylobacterium sp. J367 TaxID=2898435 RepID=UPI0021517773|nr:TetR/AcrR family transcriptional regulator [Phenylobacterium sp. J367]MCR5878889.1 TetR/AcrR family transcriptional regulator [Phenylobacterium sp. J367]
MRKGDATRVRILDEATRQVAVRGLTAASLGDVAEAVGLSKSGLFKHFESKEAMQLAVIDRVQERFSDFVWREAEPLAPGRARLEKIFDRWLDWSESEWDDHGCPLMALSVELDDQPGPLRDALQKGMLRWRRTLMREFQALTDPPLSEDQAAAAYFQMKSYLLGHSEARRLMGLPDARRSAQAAFHALLDRVGQAQP